VAGLAWGAAAGALSAPAGGARDALEVGAGEPRAPARGSLVAWLRALPLGPPAVRPGILAAVVALGLAAAYFLVAAGIGLARTPRELAGGLVLAVAVAPNAALALVSTALGSSADATLAGTGFEPVGGPLLYWDWTELEFLPAHSLVLLLAPLAGVVAGGRAAAAVAAGAGAARRALCVAVPFAAALLLVGWAGSLEATAGGGGEDVSIRVGFEPLATVVLALVWGTAGGVFGPRLRWPPRWDRRSRVSGP
ncbi:MAG TPA: hypothetical protein VHN37_12620, partial [Actinomycetota bacterium]|nr:hypothetical protein [Actinomycetota bacterium]